MKNKKVILIIATLLIIVSAGFYLYENDMADNGKSYASKQTLCMQFAQSYLRTIPKTETYFNDEKWSMAVDVETDLYNMCLLDLNKESLKNYKVNALEKYQR